MDRNQATGLVLIFGILFLYFTFFAPEPSKLPQEVKQAKKEAAKPLPVLVDSLVQKEWASLGIDSSSIAKLDTALVWIENKDIKLAISPLGAEIAQVELKKYKTWDGKSLELISRGKGNLDLTLPLNGKEVNVSKLPFQINPSSVKEKGDSILVEGVCKLGEGKFVRQRYLIPPTGYSIVYRMDAEGFQWPNAGLAKLDFSLDANQLEKDLIQNRTTTCINYYSEDNGFNNLSETSTSEEKADVENPLKWISFKQKFFNAGIIAPEAFRSAKLRQITQEADSQSVKLMQASVAIPLSSSGLGLQFYFGPNQFKVLKGVTDAYDKNVYLGWPVINLVNRFITVNVFYWLQDIIPNYGIIIIILVLLIKLLLFPLSYKSYISMAKMKVLKPELDEIKERTGDDMQKAQAEQMKLYQQVGINPLSGCIPLLLQMPILLAVFNFFPNAIELRQESFLWAPDLSTYDSIAKLPFSLPGYGDHVSLFTILMTASTLVLTFYNNQTTTVAGPMQSMSYIMPVVFMFILNSLPSGLSFYYLVSNLVSIVQQQVIKRFVDEGALRAKLEANKVKNANKKKSGFAARLEEAMRLAQEAQKEKEKQKKKG